MSWISEIRKKAADGDAQAQIDLAFWFSTNKRPNREREEYWFLQAANQGNASAQNYLGELLRDERRRFRAAARWFRLAALGKDANGQLNWGVCLFEGIGTPRNRALALRWYKKAAANRVDESGSKASAMFNIGLM
jgi:uncharacterized protein